MIRLRKSLPLFLLLCSSLLGAEEIRVKKERFGKPPQVLVFASLAEAMESLEQDIPSILPIERGLALRIDDKRSVSRMLLSAWGGQLVPRNDEEIALLFECALSKNPAVRYIAVTALNIKYDPNLDGTSRLPMDAFKKGPDAIRKQLEVLRGELLKEGVV